MPRVVFCWFKEITSNGISTLFYAFINSSFVLAIYSLHLDHCPVAFMYFQRATLLYISKRKTELNVEDFVHQDVIVLNSSFNMVCRIQLNNNLDTS